MGGRALAADITNVSQAIFRADLLGKDWKTRRVIPDWPALPYGWKNYQTSSSGLCDYPCGPPRCRRRRLLFISATPAEAASHRAQHQTGGSTASCPWQP